jgi:tagatose-1,6-bisphosphate aldolase
MADDAARKAGHLVGRLRGQGHHAAADRLAHLLTPRTVEAGLLFALREACETVLTAIEAVDPVTQTMIEELRVEVEKRLRLPAKGEGG